MTDGDEKTAPDERLTDEQSDLVRQHLSLVDQKTAQMMRSLPPHVTFAEARQDGFKGLIHAARRYDPNRGMSFENYAMHRIGGAIRDGLRERSVYSRRQKKLWRDKERLDEARRLEQTLSETLEHVASVLDAGGAPVHRTSVDALDVVSSAAPSPETAAHEALLRERIKSAAEELERTQRQLLDLYYFQGKGLQTSANELGISKGWASKLLDRAVALVRDTFRRKNGDPDI